MLAELGRATDPLSEKEEGRYGDVLRVTPASHTNIGGYLEPWMDMWTDFWETADVEWVDLDELVADVDWEIPMWQIPINKNAPYTPEKIRPLTPYEEVEKVVNPCAVINLPEAIFGVEGNTETELEEVLHIFHNNTGSMCLEALAFLDTLDYPVVVHLNTEDGFNADFANFKSDFTGSEGVSSDFGYYPTIFVGGRAFSGFDEDIQEKILELVE